MAKNTVNDKPSGGQTKGDGLAFNPNQGIKQVQSGKSGGGNVDEFAKGTVGAPDEVNAIREGANQGGMKDQTLLYGGGYFERETAGLEDGISVRETMNADATEPNYNYDIDPLTGNAPERKVGRTNNYSVNGKRGNKFEIGEM